MGELEVDVTRISEKGQIVIPKSIRENLGLHVGSKLIIIAADDSIILQKVELISGRLKVKELLSRARMVIGKLGL